MRAQFEPDYQNLVDAAYNRRPKRLPLYDHAVDISVMEKITGQEIGGFLGGDRADRAEFYRRYAQFFRTMGYDAVIYEECVTGFLPGGGALGGHKPGCIKTREDFERYPWEEIPDKYFAAVSERFELLRDAMPAGMLAAGGVGNGVFECVQDLVGYMDLCYVRLDDPSLFADMFVRVGDMLVAIWSRFLEQYGDAYCLCRMGDDLGFKSDTLLSHDDVRTHIIPQYKRIVSLIHAHNKPFLLHSCGQIFDVMDDIIDVAGIDAKHSNEDVIAPFPEWVERYGGRIGNFGGVDTDVVCSDDTQHIRDYTLDVVRKVDGCGGIAIGTGNSVPNYVSVAGYQAMNEAVREYRGA